MNDQPETQEGSLLAIWNSIFAGNEVTLQLPWEEVDNFRTTLHRYKRNQEQILLDMDLLGEDDIKRLSFTSGEDIKDNKQLRNIVVKLVARPKNKIYTIIRNKPASP